MKVHHELLPSVVYLGTQAREDFFLWKSREKKVSKGSSVYLTLAIQRRLSLCSQIASLPTGNPFETEINKIRLYTILCYFIALLVTFHFILISSLI